MVAIFRLPLCMFGMFGFTALLRCYQFVTSLNKPSAGTKIYICIYYPSEAPCAIKEVPSKRSQAEIVPSYTEQLTLSRNL
jgi:hypothetical protein